MRARRLAVRPWCNHPFRLSANGSDCFARFCLAAPRWACPEPVGGVIGNT